MNNFIESYLFYPKTIFQKFLSFLFLPFTLIYCMIVYLKFPKKQKDMQIPIISIGNIIVGGSGKTPFTIALAKKLEKNVAVVLRGYGRKSKGCIVVSKNGKIVENVEVSGDEAQEIAISTNASVIVSENREEGINKAKKLGAKVVILDDGFDKPFKKLNIVIDVKIDNSFCLPSGGYRYPRGFLKYADIILKENRDFKRVVKVPECKNCVLISAISKPERLFKFVKIDKYHFFMDHYDYKKEEIEEILKKYDADTILTTKKDYVKLKKFGFNIKVIELELEISDKVITKIKEYLVKYK
jgi:tetraacyldisaccharide 4'-kinase